MKKIGATGTWGRVELSSEATEGQRIYVEPPRDVMGVILVYGCDRIETVHPGQKAVFKARSAPNPNHDPSDPRSPPRIMVWDRTA